PACIQPRAWPSSAPMSVSLRRTEGPRPRAVIVGVQLPDSNAEAFEASLHELARLADTLGLEIVGRVTQRRAALSSAAVLGEGKLKQLAAYTGGSGVVPGYVPPGKRARAADDEDIPGAHAEHEDDEVSSAADAAAPQPAEIVVVDHDLTPSQMRTLERATGAEVLDRSMVILSIFQRHARTREARMQVEIAQLAYMAPRLREANAGQDRQRGGIGGKGAGESALELDRRRIRDRIAELRRELENVQREADTRRSRRAETEAQTVALVGYTNAGKSSLMRALTGDQVYVADQLFATLDTTVRALKPETRPRILVSDTVGFIKKLPHDLVASFRSTLEEAKDAGLLLHVVDASDPAFRDQLQVTREVLAQIGAGEQPSLLLLNKADRLDDTARAALRAEFPDGVLLSARESGDVARLHALLVNHFERDMREETLLIPYNQQRGVALLHERSRVLEERYEPEGTLMRVRAPGGVLDSLRKELGLG
ncbi:MAG TPA: GTPase HflX, partial [Polyangiales bacterium]